MPPPRTGAPTHHCPTGVDSTTPPDSGGDKAPVKDLPLPDLPLPDLPLPDLPLPDSAPPDLLTPDMAKPDMLPPDAPSTIKVLVDKDHADFIKGSSAEMGAKLWVSKQGRMQILDRLDLDRDGFLDLVVTRTFGSGPTPLPSHVYWGTGKRSFTGPASLATAGSGGAAVADLDDDGHPDVVFSNWGDGKKFNIDSPVYYGGAKRTFPKAQGLATRGGDAVTVADLDLDGHLDVIFANSYDGQKKTFATPSYIYWGLGGRKFAVAANVTTSGAAAIAVADFNKDGKPDLLFVNNRGDTTHSKDSTIHLNDGMRGFPVTWKLPTSGGTDVAVADLDADGGLDVVLTNDNGGGKVKTLIYRNNGTTTPYSSTPSSIPTHSGSQVSIADLDGNKYLDLVISNYRTLTGPPYSYSQFVNTWSSSNGAAYSLTNKVATTGAKGNLLLDWDGDGKMDQFVAQLFSGNQSTWSLAANSQIFWGDGKGKTSGVYPVPSKGGNKTVSTDPGSLFDRSPRQVFVSRVHQCKVASPAYLTLSWSSSWSGLAKPKHTTLRFQLRSGATNAAASKATWFGPAGGGGYYTNSGTKIWSGHNAKLHPFIQYRVELVGDHGNTPLLDQVSITCK